MSKFRNRRLMANKIKELKRKGKTQSQAVAIAYSMFKGKKT